LNVIAVIVKNAEEDLVSADGAELRAIQEIRLPGNEILHS